VHHLRRQGRGQAAMGLDLPMAPSPPVPDVPGYPRPLTAIHQVEVSTFCNLRCTYCPSKDLHKAKFRGVPAQHMTLETFERALAWCKHFDAQGTQHELSLTGIGETLLHPRWTDLVILAREALPDTYINFSTNGLLLDAAACEHLANYDVRVYVSLHRPEKAGPAINRAREYGIIDDVNASAAISSFDWAGQVDWEVSASADRCEWQYQGWGNVLVDGRISSCCLDAAAKGIIGHIDDDPALGALQRPFSLCGPCHQVLVEPGT
jgi:hypothetical protein